VFDDRLLCTVVRITNKYHEAKSWFASKGLLVMWLKLTGRLQQNTNNDRKRKKGGYDGL